MCILDFQMVNRKYTVPKVFVSPISLAERFYLQRAQQDCQTNCGDKSMSLWFLTLLAGKRSI